MVTRQISFFDTFQMLVLITFWGSSFIVVKIALNEGLTPIAVATFRFLTAGALFIVALLIEKKRNRNCRLRVEKKDVPTLLILAFTGITFFFTTQYTGIDMAGPSIAAIFVCLLSPIIITVLSTRIFKERLSRKQIFGIGTAAVGTFIVTVGGTLSLPINNREFFLGSLILLATPVLWAAYSLLGKKTIEKYNPFLVVAYVTILGGLSLIPFSLAENSFKQIFTLNLNSWLAIIYLSSICSLLGYYIWFSTIKKVGAALTSSFLFAEPFVTVLLAVTLPQIGEKLTAPILAGGLLIFTGVYLITKK